MKEMKVLINETKGRNPKIDHCKQCNCQFSNYLKRLFFTVAMLTATVMVHAQSIEEQAEKAGNEAFASAMVRNVMIIIGVVIFFSLFKSGKKDKENQHPE